MLAAVADTHSAVWYVFAAPSLSRNAKNALVFLPSLWPKLSISLRKTGLLQIP